MAEYIEREAVLRHKTLIPGFIGEYVHANRIKEAPAADVAPVVHARWNDDGRCTHCGGHAPYWAMASTYYESPYCFECGARMDGE